jgi:hypothetical protein
MSGKGYSATRSDQAVAADQSVASYLPQKNVILHQCCKCSSGRPKCVSQVQARITVVILQGGLV